MTQIVSGTQVAQTQPANTQAQVLVENPDARPFWMSKGVIGGFLAFVGGIGAMFGLDLAQTDIETLTVAAFNIVTAVGAILAIVGRLTAKAPIK